ncbi:hypothetical protein D1007_31247 [Hordeum vulgare]|nr:hypothetical protein D1007_31247 [Hordeum vulgare]
MTTYLEVVALGFTFCPWQKDLTDVYLRRKIAGDPLPGATARFIHEVDVYSPKPEQLTRAAARKSRTIENAVGKHWHSESYAKPVEGGSAVGGYRRYFSYKKEESGKDVKTEDLGAAAMMKTEDCHRHTSADETLVDANNLRQHMAFVKGREYWYEGDPDRAAAQVQEMDDNFLDNVNNVFMVQPGGYLAALPAAQPEVQEMDCNFLDNVNNVFMVQPGGYLATPPAAQPEVQEMDVNFLDNVNNVFMVQPGGYLAAPPAAQPEVQEMDGNFLDNVNNVFMVQPGGYLAALPAAQPEVQEMDCNFLDNVNNAFMVQPGGYLAAPPAAQPEVQEMDVNFLDNVNNVFMVQPGGYLAAPPTAQPEVQEMDNMDGLY